MHFNSIVESGGEVLFGEIEEFSDLVSGLEEEDKKKYVDELLRVELITDGDC